MAVTLASTNALINIYYNVPAITIACDTIADACSDSPRWNVSKCIQTRPEIYCRWVDVLLIRLQICTIYFVAVCKWSEDFCLLNTSVAKLLARREELRLSEMTHRSKAIVVLNSWYQQHVSRLDFCSWCQPSRENCTLCSSYLIKQHICMFAYMGACLWPVRLGHMVTVPVSYEISPNINSRRTEQLLLFSGSCERIQKCFTAQLKPTVTEMAEVQFNITEGEKTNLFVNKIEFLIFSIYTE